MGGHVFSSGPDALHTPRMSASVYRAMRERCVKKLSQGFVAVATPVEGPAKDDFGDIDFFLVWARSEIFPSSAPVLPGCTASSGTDQRLDALLDTAVRLLGAERCKQGQHGTAAAAVPWPEDLLPRDDNPGSGEGAAQPKRYIQVDIHVCKSMEHMQWMLFKHAHADLWNLLGSTIRPFGLTIDETGLWIRIPEIEPLHRSRSKVLLSSDPAAVLLFLGLAQDGAQWERPFPSAQALFDYASTCRLFWVRPADPDGGDGDGDSPDSKLSSNHRQRLRQRPLYRAWVCEFLPACRASGRFAAAPATREQVRGEAFARFPGSRARYAAQLRAWRAQRQREYLWRDVIKAALPPATMDPVAVTAITDTDTSPASPVTTTGHVHTDGDAVTAHYRGCAASALKKVILADDGGFGVAAPGPSLKPDGELFDEDKVRAWVAAHWREVGDKAWELHRERGAARAARRAAAGEE